MGQSLSLAYCAQVTDAGVEAVANKLTALTTLNLYGCNQVTDVGVKAVANKLTALTTFSLGNCTRVTDSGVEAVANKLTALTSLNIAFCTGVTDRGVKAVANKLTALTTLNLYGCDQVTDAGAKTIANKLTTLTTFNLGSCSQVTDSGVKAVANKLTALTSLNLAFCTRVTDVGVEAVANKLIALTTFNIYSCKQITDVGVEAVANKLTALTTFIFGNCPRVTDRGVKAVANKLTALTQLDLMNCVLVTNAGVKVIANKLTALTSLNLYGCNQVTNAGVKAVANNLTALTSLNLYGCKQITDVGIKAVADKLHSLTSLNLSYCARVTDGGVKAVANKLTALTSFILQRCERVSDAGVKAVANKLTALTTLNLHGCKQITDVGVKAAAHKLTALNTFSLGSCPQVTNVGVQAIADKLTSLTSFALHGCNQVTDIDVKAIADKLTSLTSLNLYDCNQITDVGVKAITDKLTSLTSLNLAFCALVTNTSVMAIANKLTSLTSLNLTKCKQVTVLPESIGALRKLTDLDLNGVQLTSLPIALRHLPRLRRLGVQRIPDLKLPEELTRNRENPRAILDYYFRTTTESKRALNEAKLILVGNEAVGKTSLVNFLVHKEPCKDTLKTPGVEIVEGVDVKGWNVGKDAAGETPLRLNVWDFGGQQVLKETHQFFLTDRSLYLVVLSARKENETEQEAHLIAWLRSIRARTVEDVPVIVVINKSEPPQELQIDEARLKREFPIIKRFVRTSCRTEFNGKGIDELRRIIVEAIRSELPHVRDQFPQSYFNVKKELARTARRASILNTNTYRDKCRIQNVTEKGEQENLLELLHRIGVVVKYNDTTLLDPNWLTTAVYRILTHPNVVTAGGEFSLNELGTLLAGLRPKDYPPTRWLFIAEMMERFGLSFRLPEARDRYLVPNQVHVAEPKLPGWNAPGLLRFRYEYQDTPARGLLPRFVVFAHRHLTNPRIAWLNGVVLSVEGCEVLVKIEPHKRQLSIAVRGPDATRRSALAVVRHHFAAVHDLNNLEPGKDVFAKIPVEISGLPDAAFDFELLENCERTGIPKMPCPGTSTLFIVKELLAGVGPEPARSRDSEVEGSDIYNIRGDGLIQIYKGEIINQLREADMGDTINITGNVIGGAIGGGRVTAGSIVANIGTPTAPAPGAHPIPARAKPEADLVLVTVNKHETKAVFTQFEAATGVPAVPVSLDDRVYNNLGALNGTRVFHALSEMGTGGPGAMQQAVDKAITALQPWAVIAVGIAFGVNEKKQKIGDILISRQLRPYDLQRVGANGITLRADKPHGSTRLLNHFDAFIHTQWAGATVRSGVVLTGEKLVDNIDYRNELLALETEAVGGEMEGAGLYVSGHDHKVDWIVLKAICDWADGNKSKNKDARQKKAANNAAQFLVEALRYAPLARRP